MRSHNYFPCCADLPLFISFAGNTKNPLQMGEQMLSLGEQLDDTDMRVEGHMILGYNLAFLKEPQLGLEHLEKAIAMYDPPRHRVRRLGLGSSPGVTSQTVSALFLWMLGYPDRAAQTRSRFDPACAKVEPPV